MKAFYSDTFVLPLPEHHRFPMTKYRLLRERLIAERIIDADDLRVADPVAWDDLRLVHDAGYVDAVANGTLPADMQRRIGFPWSPMMVERSRRSVGATLAAAREVCRDEPGAVGLRVSANLAGGTHHAFRDRGEGYCVFNDVAVAASALLRDGEIARAAVIDCDVHQGNGTAAIFRDDPRVFTFSLHGANNFPFRKETSDLDVTFEDGAGDDEYLAALEQHLPPVLDRFQPDIVFYLAGADPYEGDRLGRLELTIDGLRTRDRFVFNACCGRSLPVAVMMSGGYAPDVDAIVTIHANTIREAAAAARSAVNSQSAHSAINPPSAHSAINPQSAHSAISSQSAHSAINPQSAFNPPITNKSAIRNPQSAMRNAPIGATVSVCFRLLTEDDVKRVLTMDDLIDAMSGALRSFSTGQVAQPVRTVISVKGDEAFFGLMPAYVRADTGDANFGAAGPADIRADRGDANYSAAAASLGAKLVTVFGGNIARGLHSHLASIVLLDPDTGALRALLDGRYITEARTAAVSAVSSRLLARKTAQSLAIIGSGVQARSHLEALSRVHNIRYAAVWSPNKAHRDQFVANCTRDAAATHDGRGARPDVKAVDHAGECIVGADLIVLATSSPAPVLENGWVKPGAHVMSVGACRPNQREMDPALVARARLFVDSRAAALVESGDVVLGIQEGRFGPDHIVAEVGEVVNGAEGRRSDGEITIFKSLGLAVEDVTAADLAYRRAVERRIGQELEL